MSTLFDQGAAARAERDGHVGSAAGDRAGRFRPTRAGLRNVWEYDNADFHFAGGRVIFRGPNGSGKSNALALLFPFVLDGRAGATHMDPHGGGRNLKSLLLCQRRGDGPRRYEFESRVGYVWLELCRDTATGPRFVTIGVGARATTARDAETWFFVTDRRVGLDLDLVPDGIPLTRGGLIAALGDRLPPPVDAEMAPPPAAPPEPPMRDGDLEDEAAGPGGVLEGDDLERDIAAPDQPGRRGRRRLVSACVFDTIEEYQAAVDRALFGMGVVRLRKLVNLVLVLRRPHLAKQLDLDGLSASLSEALSPLDDEVVSTVAAAFEDLDRIRGRLKELRAAVGAVNEAVPWYRDYLRTEARARALGLVAAERAAHAAAREHQQAEREAGAAAAFVLELEQAQEEARVQQRQANGLLQGLERSAEYRAVLQLDDLAKLVSSREAAVATAEGALTEAERDSDAAAEDHRLAVEEAEAAGRSLAERSRELATAAANAGVRMATLPDLTDPFRIDLTGFAADDLRRRIDIAGRERGRELRRVWEAMERARHAEDALAAARRREAEAEERLREARNHRQAAVKAVEDARSALATGVAGWIATARAHPATRHLAADADLSPIVETLASDSAPLERAAVTLLAPDRDEATTERGNARDRKVELAVQQETLRADRQRVATEADQDRGPRRLDARPADRAGRPGAPLFACCDFADHLDDMARAGIEAALEGAGLLDAWISPNGMADPKVLDAFAVPAGARPDGPRLSAVLVPAPAPDSGLDRATVTGILDRLRLDGFDAGDGIASDGRFRLGVLAGRFAKDRAEYIGAAARAAARRRELARIDAELERLADEQRAASMAEMAAGRRLEALDQLVEALPPADALAARLRELDVETGGLRNAQKVVEQAADGARADSDRLRRVEAERDTAASAAGVVAVAERLEAVDESLQEFINLGRDTVDAARHRFSAVATLDRVAGRLAELERRRQARVVEAHTAKEQLAEDAARLEAIRTSLGGRPEEIHARMEQARQRVQDVDDHLASLETTLASAREAKGSAREAVRTADERLAAAGRDRDACAATAVPLTWHAVREAVGGAAAGSVGDALAAGRARDGTGSGTEVDANLDLAALADAIISATAGVAIDEPALEAARKGVHDAARRLRDELAVGYDPSLRPEQGLYLLEISTDDGLLSLFEARDQLTEAERTQSQRLTASEQTMFERHLFTSVVQEIQTRMNETASFVAGINQSLKATRTSSGLTVRIHWSRDSDDPLVRGAIDLLRHDPEQLDEQRRERLRRFFASSIEQARAEDPGATYAVILPGVLDYRAWHRFHLTIVDASDASTRLTPQVFKTLSGGEAAAAMHLPLLAAVDAYLASADRHAPRLVALDEAFAGIDTHLRGPLLGLLVDFDLDWVIASHELWGNYPEVPSCQIYTMRRRPPALGVHTQPTRWNGRALVAGAEG